MPLHRLTGRDPTFRQTTAPWIGPKGGEFFACLRSLGSACRMPGNCDQSVAVDHKRDAHAHGTAHSERNTEIRRSDGGA